MTEPAKKLGVKEIIKAIKRLSPGEKESLAILADPELKEGFLRMAKEAEKELRAGKTVSAGRFLKELDRAIGLSLLKESSGPFREMLWIGRKE